MFTEIANILGVISGRIELVDSKEMTTNGLNLEERKAINDDYYRDDESKREEEEANRAEAELNTFVAAVIIDKFLP